MIRQYAADPVLWVRTQLNVEPDPWQLKVLNDIANHKHVAAAGATGCGKSTLIAWLIMWFLCTRPFGRVPVTSAKATQISQQIWAEVHKWLRQSPKVEALLQWTPTRVTYKTGKGEQAEWCATQRVARVRSSDTGDRQAEGFAGLHGDHMLLIIDEASGVPDEIFDAAEGCLTGGGDNRVFVAGNPLRASGRFWSIFNSPSTTRHWQTHSIGYLDAPRVDRAWALQMIETHGSESPIVRARVFGKFPSKSRVDTCFAMDEVMDSMAREILPPEEHIVQIGVDTARYGDDETVYTVRQGLHFEPQIIDKFEEGDAASVRIADQVEVLAKKYALMDPDYPKPHLRVPIIMDGTGQGGGPIDILVDRGYKRIVEINFSCAALDDAHYANRPSEIWLESGRNIVLVADIPDDEILMHQLVSRRFAYEETKNITRKIIESKRSMKRRGLPSPDRAESLLLACVDPDEESCWTDIKFW